MLPYDLIELDALITPIDHVHFESSMTFKHLFITHNFEPQ
jgi:hypothetical protein